MPAPHGPGDRIAGRYEILRVLGRGGFGTTYAARDTVRGDEVAIKELDLRRVDEWKSVELFEREAAVLRRLSHPRIPRYVDFLPIEADRAGLLIQELAPGRPLDQVLDQEGRLDEARVVAIADQLLEVLVYLGGLDPPVVHRDIKPANVILDAHDQLRLVDFGAVKDAAARASTVGSTVAGTFGYMAPEVVRGTGEPRSDLYSVGMMMIALLTGIVPTDLPSRRLKPEFRGRVPCSTAVADVIDRLIEPVPDDRFADARAAREALADAVASAAAVSGADLGALVAARERAGRRAQEEAAALARRERDASAAKLAGRPRRVSVAAAGDRTRITFARILLRDALVEQLPWGIFFAFFNPGAFVVVGLTMYLSLARGIDGTYAVLAAIGIWSVTLLGINVVYAALRRRPLYLDLSGAGAERHFAVHHGDPRRAALLGRSAELRARIPEPDPSSLAEVNLEAGNRVTVPYLSAADLVALRDALRGWCRVD